MAHVYSHTHYDTFHTRQFCYNKCILPWYGMRLVTDRECSNTKATAMLHNYLWGISRREKKGKPTVEFKSELRKQNE